jgi:hypothetical protein
MYSVTVGARPLCYCLENVFYFSLQLLFQTFFASVKCRELRARWAQKCMYVEI